MAHGFGGIRAARLDAFAERFRQAGVAALVFDYRHHGTSEGRPRGLIDIAKQREDYRAAITYVRGLAGINPHKVAVWGTSFSGGHVLSVVADDHRIAAGVLTNPYVDGPAGIAKTRRVTRIGVRLALARAAVMDELRRVRGREPHRVAIAGPPGSAAIFTTPDAAPGFESILPPDRSRWGWEPAVPARIVLRIATDRPARRLSDIGCPLLVSVCDRDQIAPVRPAVRVARMARYGELYRYPFDHFDVFAGAGFERVVRDQTAFLRRTLLEAS